MRAAPIHLCFPHANTYPLLHHSAFSTKVQHLQTSHTHTLAQAGLHIATDLSCTCLCPCPQGCGSARNMAWIMAREPVIPVVTAPAQQGKHQPAPALDSCHQHQSTTPSCNGCAADDGHAEGNGPSSTQAPTSTACKGRTADAGHTEEGEPSASQVLSTSEQLHASLVESPSLQTCCGTSDASKAHSSRQEPTQRVAISWSALGLDFWYGALARTQDLFQHAAIPPEQAALWWVPGKADMSPCLHCHVCIMLRARSCCACPAHPVSGSSGRVWDRTLIPALTFL